MKKTLFIALFLTIMVVARPAFAETNFTPAQVSSIQQVINSLLQQIQLLMVQLKEVQAQEAITQQNQTAITTQVQQIIQNTTPAPVQSFGSVTQVQTQVDKSNITFTKSAPYDNGAITFKVTAFDTDGTCTKNLIIMDAQDRSGAEREPSNHYANTRKMSDNDCNAYFGYLATSTGIKTITFTSGNLSTSTTIDIK